MYATKGNKRLSVGPFVLCLIPFTLPPNGKSTAPYPPNPIDNPRYTLRRSNLRSVTCPSFHAPRHDVRGSYLPSPFALLRKLPESLQPRKKDQRPLPPLRSPNRSLRRFGNP